MKIRQLKWKKYKDDFFEHAYYKASPFEGYSYYIVRNEDINESEETGWVLFIDLALEAADLFIHDYLKKNLKEYAQKHFEEIIKDNILEN